MPELSGDTWDRYPSIVALLRELAHIKENVNRLVQIKTQLEKENGETRQELLSTYRALIGDIRNNISSTREKTDTLIQSENKHYRSGRALLSKLSELENELSTLRSTASSSPIGRSESVAGRMISSRRYVDSAFLERSLVVTALLGLCAITSMLLFYGGGTLVDVAAFSYVAVLVGIYAVSKSKLQAG